MSGRRITKRSSPTEDPDAYLQEEEDMIFNRLMSRGAMEHHATGRFSFRDLGVSDEEYLRQTREQYAARMQMAERVTTIPDDIRAPRRYATRQEYAPSIHHIVQMPQDFYTEWEESGDIVPLGGSRRRQGQGQRQRGGGGGVIKKVVQYYVEEVTDSDDDSDDDDV